MRDLDPRPVIAGRLDHKVMYVVLNSGRAQTERLLDELVPEGAPWTAVWHDPDRFGNYLTITSGAVTARLATHPALGDVSAKATGKGA